MAFLERNLEQLTVVQRQLVEQNSSLKKEVAIAERKLIARNERIQSLESLLQDSQEKLTAANHRYIYSPCPSYPTQPAPYTFTTSRAASTASSPSLRLRPSSSPHRFEAQLTAVKARLEAAKLGSTKGLGSPTSSTASFAFGVGGSRIAKPLRGGGEPMPVVPTLGSLQQQEVGGAGGGKRSSWFFNQRS